MRSITAPTGSRRSVFNIRPPQGATDNDALQCRKRRRRQTKKSPARHWLIAVFLAPQDAWCKCGVLEGFSGFFHHFRFSITFGVLYFAQNGAVPTALARGRTPRHPIPAGKSVSLFLHVQALTCTRKAVKLHSAQPVIMVPTPSSVSSSMSSECCCRPSIMCVAFTPCARQRVQHSTLHAYSNHGEQENADRQGLPFRKARCLHQAMRVYAAVARAMHAAHLQGQVLTFLRS
jgi:hypothetical protein